MSQAARNTDRLWFEKGDMRGGKKMIKKRGVSLREREKEKVEQKEGKEESNAWRTILFKRVKERESEVKRKSL